MSITVGRRKSCAPSSPMELNVLRGTEVNPDGPMGAGCKRNPRLPAAFESEAAGGV